MKTLVCNLLWRIKLMKWCCCLVWYVMWCAIRGLSFLLFWMYSAFNLNYDRINKPNKPEMYVIVCRSHMRLILYVNPYFISIIFGEEELWAHDKFYFLDKFILIFKIDDTETKVIKIVISNRKILVIPPENSRPQIVAIPENY